MNLFETTIRILGGLLAAFHIDNHSPLWLDRALELGLRMTPALTQSPSGAASAALRRHGQTQLDTMLLPALCVDLDPSELHVRCCPASCVWVTWDSPVHDPGSATVLIRCDESQMVALWLTGPADCLLAGVNSAGTLAPFADQDDT